MIPTVTDVDMAFPCRWKELLPRWEELTQDEKRGHGPFCAAVSRLFYNGVRLEDVGVTPKPGVEGYLIDRYLKATLGDFGPKHEHKIGGIAHRLAEWCDYKPA